MIYTTVQVASVDEELFEGLHTLIEQYQCPGHHHMWHDRT